MPPKRPPPDMEQLLCAMLKLKGYPSGSKEWQYVADCMPDKPEGGKHSAEATRGMWRRLSKKWEEEGIGSDEPPVKNDDEEEGESSKQVPKSKSKGKGKGKGKMAKGEKVMLQEPETEEEESEVEG